MITMVIVFKKTPRNGE